LEITVEGVKYKIKPIPPYLMPFIDYFLKITAHPAENMEEAKKIGEEIDTIFTTIFKETVEPMPKPEHAQAVFAGVTEYVNKLRNEVLQFFLPSRKKRRRKKVQGED